MLQAASTDLFNPLVPKTHATVNVEIYYFLFKLSHQKLFKTSLRICIFCTIGTNGLILSDPTLTAHQEAESEEARQWPGDCLQDQRWRKQVPSC